MHENSCNHQKLHRILRFGENRMKNVSKLKRERRIMLLEYQTTNILMEYEIGTYSVILRPSTPIKNVICNVYGNDEI